MPIIQNDNKELKPLVSFIITYYNEPIDMLRECIESILSLSLSASEREVILIDDGSDICPINDLVDIRDSIVYVRKKNEGLSIARNIGIKACHGEYIQFVDADDYLVRNAYEHCLDIVRYHNPDIVLFRSTNKHETETPWVLPEPITGSEYMRHNNMRASACGYVFRQKVLHELKFTPNILHEDEDFTPQLLLRCERVFDTQCNAYFYRKREDSITNKIDKRSVIKRLDDIENVIFRLYDKLDTLSATDRAAMQRRINQLTMDYIYNVIRLTKSWHFLQQRIDRIYDKGLYPLPLNHYTKKYYWFARMSSSKAGLRILFAMISITR